ncbi:MAG: acetyl-CoA carboxylase biotin carboxylase subunit [Oceanidesulfovibrio sp.]
MFRRVLIANRGETALRIIRTLRERGVVSVLAHSDVDSDSLPARQADERVCIGPAPPQKSYLNATALVSAALTFRCEALHPGWGFLSESPALAKLCEENGITFIGPRSTTMAHLGDKIAARISARKADVPVIPGSHSAVANATEARSVARDIGYPLLLKAASGGGGRGIRLVESDDGIAHAFAEASAEAVAAFGDSRLYVEALLSGMRHVEVQVAGDGHGGAVHLYERDCSLQRRRQKLMEEAPAVLVPEGTRQAIREAAVRLTGSLEYAGVGTIEFLVRGDDFHFMEMNARLQVEHTVTELITGTDLVDAQLVIAAEGRSPWAQEEIIARGHAVQCRINAEDPVLETPSPGIVEALAWPGGPGVRVDTALYPGAEVSVWYDSLVAKIAALAEDRERARARLKRALAETEIRGVATNVSSQASRLDEDAFASASV